MNSRLTHCLLTAVAVLLLVNLIQPTPRSAVAENAPAPRCIELEAVESNGQVCVFRLFDGGHVEAIRMLAHSLPAREWRALPSGSQEKPGN
jgi:hypothetical protein